MNVLLFGASGMIGRGVLRECLLAPDVESVRSIGRASIPIQHAKLEQLVRPEFSKAPETLLISDLRDVDACFFCLGVTSAGMTEVEYANITYRLTLNIAERLVRTSPEATFIYVSGAGAYSSERGRTMWARVRGKTENALLRLPFKRVHAFRPALVQPMHGIESKTKAYRSFYRALGPVVSVGRKLFPTRVLSTEVIGRAMLSIARSGTRKGVLESADIYRVVKPKRDDV